VAEEPYEAPLPEGAGAVEAGEAAEPWAPAREEAEASKRHHNPCWPWQASRFQSASTYRWCHF